jgi:hypothetical protein
MKIMLHVVKEQHVIGVSIYMTNAKAQLPVIHKPFLTSPTNSIKNTKFYSQISGAILNIKTHSKCSNDK